MANKLRWLTLLIVLICTQMPVLAQVGDGTLRRIRVPILMYHYVSPLPPDADDIRRNLTVLPEMFAAHLQYLADEGYTTISLYKLYDALTTGAPLPPKPVILTFDDGYRDHYEVVFPALQEYGFTGTFFIITGRADANDPAHLTWDQISEMAAAGMSMEAHTKNHLDLRERDRDLLIYELLGSRESLDAHTGAETRMLAYPVGHFDALTLQITRELNFWLAVTTRPGAAHVTTDLLQLPRLRVSYDTQVPGLAHLLNSAK